MTVYDSLCHFMSIFLHIKTHQLSFKHNQNGRRTKARKPQCYAFFIPKKSNLNYLGGLQKCNFTNKRKIPQTR